MLPESKLHFPDLEGVIEAIQAGKTPIVWDVTWVDSKTREQIVQAASRVGRAASVTAGPEGTDIITHIPRRPARFR